MDVCATVESQYNELLFNEVLGITERFCFAPAIVKYMKKTSIKQNLLILCFHMTSPKIQTKKLSLLLSFYFHVVFQHLLKTFIQTNFQKGSSFCDTGRLNFQAFVWPAFSWRPGKLLCGVKNITDLGRFCYLNIPCLFVPLEVTQTWRLHTKL